MSAINITRFQGSCLFADLFLTLPQLFIPLSVQHWVVTDMVIWECLTFYLEILMFYGKIDWPLGSSTGFPVGFPVMRLNIQRKYIEKTVISYDSTILGGPNYTETSRKKRLLIGRYRKTWS